MMTRLLRNAPVALGALVLLLCLAEGPAHAAPPVSGGVAVSAAAGTGETPAPQGISLPPGVAGVDRPAGGLGGNGFFTSFASRSRVVQFCAGAMCLALFILMKKFTEPD